MRTIITAPIFQFIITHNYHLFEIHSVTNYYLFIGTTKFKHDRRVCSQRAGGEICWFTREAGTNEAFYKHNGMERN